MLTGFTKDRLSIENVIDRLVGTIQSEFEAILFELLQKKNGLSISEYGEQYRLKLTINEGKHSSLFTWLRS